MKAFTIVLTLLFSFKGWSEFDTQYLKVEITSTNPDFPNALRIWNGYFEFRSDLNYTNWTGEDWKGYFNTRSPDGQQLVLFKNLIHYVPVIDGDSIDFGYVIRDTFSIPISLILKVDVLESYRQSLLSNVYTKLDPYDDYWINQPVVDQRYYSVPSPTCEECDLDLIYSGYSIFVHETSAEVTAILDKLDALEELRQERHEMGEDYGEPYYREEKKRLQEFYTGYSRMFEILIDLLENKKVVVIYDSGW